MYENYQFGIFKIKVVINFLIMFDQTAIYACSCKISSVLVYSFF